MKWQEEEEGILAELSLFEILTEKNRFGCN